MFPTRTPSGDLVARPRVVFLSVVAWTVVLVAGAFLGWFALPAHVRALFTAIQVGTLLLFLAIMLGILWVVALSIVRADAAGVTIRNGLKTHRIPWSQVRGVEFTRHDSFAYLITGDGHDRRLMLGIMRSDGPRSDELVAELRSDLARYGD